MKKTTKRDLKLEVIYKTALKVFAEYGYKKSTIGDIAGELDTAKSSLYFYVEDKRDLYNKAVAYGLTFWQNRVREAVSAEKDPSRQFSIMAHKALEYLGEDRHLRMVLMRDPDLFPLHPSNDPYSAINRESQVMLKDILKRGMDKGTFRTLDLDNTSALIFSFYVLIVRQIYMDPEESMSGSMFETGIDLILEGLLAR